MSNDKKIGSNPSKENRAQVPFALLICAIFIVPFMLVLVTGAILQLPPIMVGIVLAFSVGTMISIGYGLWNKMSQELSGKLTVPLLFRIRSGVWWSRDVTFASITPIVDKQILQYLIPKAAGQIMTEDEALKEDEENEKELMKIDGKKQTAQTAQDAINNIKGLAKKRLIPYKMIVHSGLEGMDIAGMLGIFHAPVNEVFVPITGNAFHKGLFVPASVSPATEVLMFEWEFPDLGRVPVVEITDSDYDCKVRQSYAGVANITPDDVSGTMSAFGASEALALKMDNVTKDAEIKHLTTALSEADKRVEKEVAARYKALLDVDDAEEPRFRFLSLKKFWLYFALFMIATGVFALITKAAHMW